jgi:hypothetical protein
MGIVWWQQGHDWNWTYQNYFSPSVMADIKNNLHATYIRTGWIPNWVYSEPVPWQREDSTMDNACAAGLFVHIIVPPPYNDSRGMSDWLSNVQAFFARYTQRDPGCLWVAEVMNEANIDSHLTLASYASDYEQVAPIIAKYDSGAVQGGVRWGVITSGTSGEDLSWTRGLYSDLQSARSPVNGYSFHPYGVAVNQMAQAVWAEDGADNNPFSTWVTEICETDATSLYNTIVNLDRWTPEITIYTYKPGPGDAGTCGLANNPSLYSAVQQGFAYVYNHNSVCGLTC